MGEPSGDHVRDRHGRGLDALDVAVYGEQCGVEQLAPAFLGRGAPDDDDVDGAGFVVERDEGDAAGGGNATGLRIRRAFRPARP
jgi:hypothetical protein